MNCAFGHFVTIWVLGLNVLNVSNSSESRRVQVSGSVLSDMVYQLVLGSSVCTFFPLVTSRNMCAHNFVRSLLLHTLPCRLDGSIGQSFLYVCIRRHKTADTLSPWATRCHGVEDICCLIRSTDDLALIFCDLWINNEHFVTTISYTRILFSDDVLNDVGDRFENLIANLVSKGIVNGFKLI